MFQTLWFRTPLNQLRRTTYQASSPQISRVFQRCFYQTPIRGLAARDATQPFAKPSSRTFPVPRLTNLKGGSYQNYANTLIQGKEEKLLYRADTSRLFLFFSYSNALLLYSMAVFAVYTNILWKGADPTLWKKAIGGVAAVGSTCVGTLIFLGTVRRVRTITAVPRNGGLLLRIVYPRPIPLWRKPIELLVKPADVVLESKLEEAGFKARMERSPLERERGATPKKLSSLGRAISQIVYKGFVQVRRAISWEGFLNMKIRGKNGFWKLDLYDGYFRDSGKALEKLVSYDFA